MLKAALRLAGVLLLVVASGAGARSLEISRFDAAIGVAADGSIDVQESIVVHFTGAWNGIYRTIPVEYRTPRGLDYSLRLSIASITNEFDQPLKHEIGRERGYRKVKIWVPGAEDATHTIHIHYRVENALRFFDEHDELYWNVTGNEWDVPIAASSATILFPPNVTGLRATAFRGAYGSTEHNAVAIDNRTVRIAADRLAFHEGLTAVVGWNPGVVHRPTRLEHALALLRDNWQLAVPVAVFMLLWPLWWFRGRDPDPGSITTMYEPPQNLSPGEAGGLIDGVPDMRDITATLVDLAVRGYVRIEQDRDAAKTSAAADTPATRDAEPQYAFTSLEPHKEWNALKTHESLLLAGVFENRDHVPAADLKNKFYIQLVDIKQAIMSSLIEQGFYAKDPADVAVPYVLSGMALGAGLVVWVVMAFLSNGGLEYPSVVTAGCGVVTGALFFGFGVAMPARTREGNRVYAKLKGFQEFLARVDGDRMNRTVKSPELFEKYLPYAMVLGVESEWAAAFKDIYTQTPEWYIGTSPIDRFDALSFAGQMHRMSADVGSIMTSAPRDAGTSGFDGGSYGGGGDGGGFSGGGFGGGGGGGF